MQRKTLPELPVMPFNEKASEVGRVYGRKQRAAATRSRLAFVPLAHFGPGTHRNYDATIGARPAADGAETHLWAAASGKLALEPVAELE